MHCELRSPTFQSCPDVIGPTRSRCEVRAFSRMHRSGCSWANDDQLNYILCGKCIRVSPVVLCSLRWERMVCSRNGYWNIVIHQPQVQWATTLDKKCHNQLMWNGGKSLTHHLLHAKKSVHVCFVS